MSDDVVPSSASTSCMWFTLILFSDLVCQNLCRIATMFDFLLLSSYSPLCVSNDSFEPMTPVLDFLCLVRIALINLIYTFRRSSGIWPDFAMVSISSLGVFFAYNLTFTWSVFFITVLIISAEFASAFWSPDRRRQRKLWVHNAEFRITSLRRNPFQRNTRRSLLLPLLSRADQPPVDVPVQRPPTTPQLNPLDLRKNILPLDEYLISTFTDIIPETTGYKAEKKVLHVHSIETTQVQKVDDKDVIVFLHQFGSGAFTWQQVMSSLASDKTSGLLAFDRVAHGMTFPDQNPIVDFSEDATPHGEDLSKVLHFSDSIQTEEFDVSLINDLAGDKRVVIVTCGGAGARLALLYMQQFPDRVRGLVLISPYGINTGNGVPTILKSVASASVGRALIVSMARSEILQVIPHRGWHCPSIPENVLGTYARSVEVPGWEDCMLGYLQRPTSEVNVSVPTNIPCLIVEGEYDRCRESTNEYAELKSLMGDHVQITSIPEVGAWPQEEKPDVVAQIIKQFMTSIR